MGGTLFDNLEFAHNYSVSVVSSPMETLAFQLYEFDWQRQKAGTNELTLETASGDDLVIEVFPPTVDPWIGRFRRGEGGISGLFGTPVPSVVCVVANGQGYWVPVTDPNSFQEVRCIPVKHVVAIPDKPVIVFGSYTELVAYGECGWLWCTERLSWDGLEILEVTKDRIRGLAWDSPSEKQVEFVVDVDSGQHHGGSSPEAYAQQEN